MRRALVNENADIVRDHPTYIMKITGDDREGKAQLDNFIDPDEKYPTIVTTSKLLTTGVNCKTCKVVVLDNKFGEHGMTEFKQIIGRGTRICEDYDKLYFTILDFRDASRLFADPEFDGEPVVVFEPNPGDPIADPGSRRQWRQSRSASVSDRRPTRIAAGRSVLPCEISRSWGRRLCSVGDGAVLLLRWPSCN